MINLKDLCESFKGANPDLVNTILDVIVAHPNNFIIDGKYTSKQTRPALIRDFLKDTGTEYKPNYKKLIKHAEVFLNYTPEAKIKFIYDKVIPIVNPNKLTFEDIHSISKKDLDIKKTYFQVINPWTKEQVFLNCSQSEPHKITRILNQTTKNKSLDTLETPGLDFELYGDIKFRQFSINTYKIIDTFLGMYKDDTYGMEGSIFPLTLLIVENLSNKLLEDLIFAYSEENKTHIPLTDIKNTDLLKLNKFYSILEFLHHNMFIYYDNKIIPCFNLTDISFYKEKEKLGGFSLYNNPLKDSRESDIFGFFNVYVLNSYRGMGFSKLIFDEVDRIVKETNITLYSSTKSSAMKNNFQKYNWELKGKYIPQETDDIFIAEEYCYVKGNKDIQTKIYPEKFITKETFFNLCKLDIINKNDYEIPQKTLFELDYLDLVLNKNVEYLGEMPRETRKFYSIQSYKLFPGLKETSIEWDLYSFKQEKDTNNTTDTINFIIPNYDGYKFRFNQPLISTNLFKEFDYRICSNGNFEIVMKVSIKNIKKILEKVYAFDYEDTNISNIYNEFTFPINLDPECLFRQDFYFIEDTSDWEDFKEYLEKFNSRDQYKNFLKEINIYNIDINGIKKNLEKTIEESNKTNLKVLDSTKIEYEFFQNKCQIFLQYNNTSVNFFYVVLYLMYLKETKGQ